MDPEQRKAPRVQCFNLAQENQSNHFEPVWVFRSRAGTAVLGLLLDISEVGAQVLSDKTAPLEAEHYAINVQRPDTRENGFPTLEAQRVWSRMEGTLYWRTGFSIVASPHSQATILRIQEAVQAGEKWMRCELTPR